MSSRSGLVVTQVSHSYGSFRAVREVDLRIEPGQVHCLLGPSGSGKSTLLRLVAGLERLQKGRIVINGVEVAVSEMPGTPQEVPTQEVSGTVSEAGTLAQEVTSKEVTGTVSEVMSTAQEVTGTSIQETSGTSIDIPPERRSIGFVFQDYALFPHLNVLRNVLFGMPHSSSEESQMTALELLERVDMAGHAKSMPHTLSGGQQQRVALARALARDPAVMLLDEPFSGLDARLRQTIRDTTLDVLRAAGVATLMVTHDPSEALLTSDVVSVIRQGQIVQSGPPSEVYARSASRPIAEVFGPVNRFAGVVTAGQIDTPFGRIDAPNLSDGRQVEILLRPESHVLSPWTESSGSTSSSPAAAQVEGVIAGVAREVGWVQVTATLNGTTSQRDAKVMVHGLGRHGWKVGDRVHVDMVEGSAMVHPDVSSDPS